MTQKHRNSSPISAYICAMYIILMSAIRHSFTDVDFHHTWNSMESPLGRDFIPNHQNTFEKSDMPLILPCEWKLSIKFQRYAWGIYNLGAVSIRKTVLPGMAIPMLKIRRPNGRLIFNMEKSPHVDKTVFILRQGPVNVPASLVIPIHVHESVTLGV